MKTAKSIVYHMPIYGEAVIPPGAHVEPASNMPETSHIKYWVTGWKGMTQREHMHSVTYGFGVGESDVTL